MTEKLTDAEIIKALEYCCGSIQNDCKDCPFGERCENDESLLRYAFDLVNRKTEEICVLYDALEAEQYKVCELTEALDGRDVEIMNLKHEIERLQAEVDKWKCALKNGCELSKCINKGWVMNEAYRELAEKLKENTLEVDVSYGYGKEHYTEVVAVVEIDNTLDELTGGE